MTSSRLTALVGLVIAIAGTALITSSIRDWLVLAALLCSGPIAVLAPSSSHRPPLAIGGAMVIAGLATSPGGNVLGLVMAAIGLLVLAGWKRRPTVDSRLVGLSVAYAVAFTVGVLAGLSAASGWSIVLSSSISVAIVLSTWIPAYRGQAPHVIDVSG